MKHSLRKFDLTTKIELLAIEALGGGHTDAAAALLSLCTAIKCNETNKVAKLLNQQHPQFKSNPSLTQIINTR